MISWKFVKRPERRRIVKVSCLLLCWWIVRLIVLIVKQLLGNELWQSDICWLMTWLNLGAHRLNNSTQAEQQDTGSFSFSFGLGSCVCLGASWSMLEGLMKHTCIILESYLYLIWSLLESCLMQVKHSRSILETCFKHTKSLLEAYLKPTQSLSEAYLETTWSLFEAYLKPIWSLLEAYLVRHFCRPFCLRQQHRRWSWVTSVSYSWSLIFIFHFLLF